MSSGLIAIADPAVRTAFREWLLRTADDELIIGHRHSEWTGFGPDIESDVAMSSIAQEELGHARLLYQQIVSSGDTDLDRLAFGRSAAAYHHAALLERPNGGWEHSIVRLALYEPFEAARYRLMGASGYDPAATLARTLVREERYHGLFAETWLTRLAQSGDEGRGKIQAALEDIWPDALGLFEGSDGDGALVAAGIATESGEAQLAAWQDVVCPLLVSLGLTIPSSQARTGGRRGVHTPEFDRLLAQMTEVWASEPEARW
jgi:ring-1,2-phenylacetyl-CoA epoxidase subunit PaaC